MPRPRTKDRSSAGFRHRGAFKLLTSANSKTPKGEAAGDYMTAILYLAPHTLGGKKSVCPFSTPACREMCLAGAGLAGLELQTRAKLNRTQMFHDDFERMLELIHHDIRKLMRIAAQEGLDPAVRLNGTSDISWEAFGIMQAYPSVQFYDYTKVPLHHRRPPANYHLTFSVEGGSVERAEAYLAAGHSVAAVVPEYAKGAIRSTAKRRGDFRVVDGDAHDLRFLDKAGSLVLLKPKGNVHTDLIMPSIDFQLRDARSKRLREEREADRERMQQTA